MDATPEARLLDECRLLLSHEMRSPLMVMEGFAQQLLDEHGGQLGDKGAVHLRRMLGATQRLSAQVDGMLVLMDAVRRPLQHEHVDFSALCDEVAGRHADAAPARVVAMEVQPAMQCSADPHLLRLAIDSLLANAWKFTAGTEAARVRVGQDSDGFYVEDNGAGFEPTRAYKLFTPFGKLHPAGEFAGVGLGLTLARHMVERHGGRIWAEGAPGLGSRFRFTLAPPA
jgi:signal transduction histidine kinase